MISACTAFYTTPAIAGCSMTEFKTFAGMHPSSATDCALNGPHREERTTVTD